MARPLSQAQQRELLSRWESRGAEALAPLSAAQQDAVLDLVTKTVEAKPKDDVIPTAASTVGAPSSPLASSVTSGYTPASTATMAPQPVASTEALLNPQRIESSQQFLEWFQQVEAHMEHDQEQNHRIYGELLREYRRQCQDAIDEIDKALAYLKDLTSLHESASTKTNILHTACQKLLEDQTSLVQYAETLARRLNYFNEHERIQKKLSSPTLSVLSDQFIPLLTRIDDCIAFLREHDKYQDSPTYLLRFQQLQNKALALVRAHITNTLKTATQNVMTQTQEPARIGTNAAEAATASTGSFTLFYGKFRMYAPRIRTLMEELESRKQLSADYHTLLEACYDCYFQQRATLLLPSLKTTVADIVKQHENDLPALMRAGCAHMVRVCVNEHQLYHHFFSRLHPGLDELLDHLTRVLYDAVRPLYLKRSVDLDTLVELCSVLNVEVLDDKGTEVAAFAHVAQEMLGDVQERLALRAADIYVDKHIRGYTPTAADLNYPQKLVDAAKIAAQAPAVKTSSGQQLAEATAMEQAALSAWYPPLAHGLVLLSKLYQALDHKVYDGLAQDILTELLQSLRQAHQRIKSERGELHGNLFFIKHLLALREQIAPFEGEFAVRQVSLDFAGLRAAAQNLFSQGTSSLFRFDVRNMLMSFMTGGMPTVTQTEVDARKEVDETLRQVCQEFIQQTAKTMGQPLGSFLLAVDALPAQRRSNLAREAFATPAKVSALLAAEDELLGDILPSLRQQLELYLGGVGSDAERVLFRPIKTAVIDLYKRLFSVIHSYYSATEQGEISNLPTLAALESMVSLDRTAPSSSRQTAPEMDTAEANGSAGPSTVQPAQAPEAPQEHKSDTQAEVALPVTTEGESGPVLSANEQT